jgi:methyl coenzyme M reductase alpha subunit
MAMKCRWLNTGCSFYHVVQHGTYIPSDAGFLLRVKTAVFSDTINENYTFDGAGPKI